MGKKKISGKYSAIALRLRAVREYLKLGSKEMADGAGVPSKSYSQWESGEFRISIDGALKIQERYGISLDFIYTGKLDTLQSKVANAISSSPLLKNSKASTVKPD